MGKRKIKPELCGIYVDGWRETSWELGSTSQGHLPDFCLLDERKREKGKVNNCSGGESFNFCSLVFLCCFITFTHTQTRTHWLWQTVSEFLRVLRVLLRDFCQQQCTMALLCDEQWRIRTARFPCVSVESAVVCSKKHKHTQMWHVCRCVCAWKWATEDRWKVSSDKRIMMTRIMLYDTELSNSSFRSWNTLKIKLNFRIPKHVAGKRV